MPPIHKVRFKSTLVPFMSATCAEAMCIWMILRIPQGSMCTAACPMTLIYAGPEAASTMLLSSGAWLT